MAKKFIIGGIVIFIILVSILGFLFYKNGNLSDEMLELTVSGPTNAIAGEEIEYTVEYKNNADFVLENPKLTFEYPSNTLSEDGRLRFTQDLSDVAPREQKSIKFKAKLLGKENDVKVATVSLSYTPRNLSIRYEADATLSTKIDAIPIGLTLSLPEGAPKGQEITYFVNYASLIEYPMENMSIRVDMGSGFTFVASSPGSLDNREWKLSTLQKLSKGIITIKGIPSGDAGSTVNFVAKLGMWQNGTFVVLKETTGELVIVEPLLLEQGPGDFPPDSSEAIDKSGG